MARFTDSKARSSKQLKRKPAQREPYDRILIVTEGSRTEVQYFCGIRKHYHLPNVMVHSGSGGTEPMQVVQNAKDWFNKGNIERNIDKGAFERVYVVFDRDEHKSYNDALKEIKRLDDSKLKNDYRQAVRFQAIPSVPCFELWLLLHYQDLPNDPLSCKDVIDRLKKHLKDYTKNMDELFKKTCGNLEGAVQRAAKLAQHSDAYSYPLPFTAIDTLVTELRNLKK